MSETAKADIVERLREYARWAEYLRLRNTLNDAIAEIERLRALPSRSDVLEEAARVADKYNDSANRLLTGDARYGANTATQGVAAAIRSLKDTDND